MSSTAVVSELDGTDLENVLQQIFMECDTSLSMSTMQSAVLIGDEVSVFKIVEYVRHQMPSLPFEHLLELWKCLVAVSANERVNLRKFKEATKRWIAKVGQTQDGNNNIQEKVCNGTSNMTMDPLKTDMDKDITELELRMRVRKIDEDNIVLREELVRAEDLVTHLERQRNNLENQLERYIKKCQQLEKENDEQKDKMDDMMMKEKSCVSALQRSTKEHKNLLKQLETAEIEVQVIPSLKEKMEKVTKEKMEYQKQIVKLQEKFYEKEEENERLKTTMAELQDTSISIKDSYEYTIRNLREKNRQLIDENIELQSWSTFQGTSGERLSMSPVPETDGCCTHSTPYKSEQVLLHESLYTELKASGFTVECSILQRQELEEELNAYHAAISTIIGDLEKIVQSYSTERNYINVPQIDPSNAEDITTYNIEALRHKVDFLLNMLTEEIVRRKSITNSSTQLRADSSGTEDLDRFGITNFQNLLIRARQVPKAETDLRSITSQCVNDNEDNPFLKVIQAKAGIQERAIEELVEELDNIVQDISPVGSSKNSALRNTRQRSIHTLLSSSLKSIEDTKQIPTPYHSSFTNLLDADAFTRGDSLISKEKCGEKSTELETESRNVTVQKDLLHFEEPQSNEMPKQTSLQMDSKLATLEETNDENFQIPKINEAAAIAAQNPRRKVSVYYRSFDVVTVRDSRDNDQGSSMEVRRSLSNPFVQYKKLEDKTAKDHDQDNPTTYVFNTSYRNTKNDSDSSNSVSPQKLLRDSIDDELSSAVQQIPKTVCLAPSRLKFSQQVGSGSNEIAKAADTTNTKDFTPRDTDVFESGVTTSFLSDISILDYNKHKKNKVFINSSPTFTDKNETVDSAIFNSTPYSANEISSRQSVSACLVPHNKFDPVKIVNPEDPHSRTSVQRVSGDQPRVARSVDNQMSSHEDTSAGSDSSECEPAGSSNRCADDVKIANEDDRATAAVSAIGYASTKLSSKNTMQNDGKARCDRELNSVQQNSRQLPFIAGRSSSEGEINKPMICRCGKRNNIPLISTENKSKAFPSLTDFRLQESGIANSSEVNVRENLSELELQKKYTAFSLCLCTDRVTLPQRMEVSQRQRNQSEKNLTFEVQKMLQDIQELAPLCTDRESVERVERVRQQLDMVARCAHRVSCTAETLGAVHQEYRISRAVLLADRYLQLLQSRCEKLAANVAETKRILTEHNIVIEESSGELCDDLPRIRYRSGTPSNNRMMMARRRASVATMSRPMGSTQDVTKEIARQRNSVSGRVTLRRPSLTCESPKWENERLDRTDSSSSIGELRGIFEHVEPRRCSSEENNNMLRSSQSNSQNINSGVVDDENWTNAKQNTSHELLPVNEDIGQDNRPTRSSWPFRLRNMVMSWRLVFWGILVFFFGFYIHRAISTTSTCGNRFYGWSIKELLRKYIGMRNAAMPHPL